MPTTLSTTTAVEWDFFIDSDNNRSTGWNLPSICNDIGPDYIISVNLSGSQKDTMVLNNTTGKFTSVPSTVNGKVIEVSFNFSVIPKLDSFDCVVATRKWAVIGNNKNLVAADKAPDAGHYNSVKGLVLVKQGLPTVKIDSSHCTVYCNEGNEDYGRWVAQSFEQGYTSIGTLLGAYAQQKFTIYTYLTQANLVQGLQTFSGYSAVSAAYFQNSGAPRPFNYIMHLPVEFTEHAIIHEYAHTILDQIGGQAYKSIKWLDEGLADYLAYLSLQNTSEKDNEATWSQNQLNLVKTALSQAKLFSLSAISDESQWSARAGSDNTLEYAESYILVSFAVSKYGLKSCTDILSDMKGGDSQDTAIQKALSISRAQLEADFQKSLA